METSPARQAREVWLPNLPCVRPAGGPLSSPAHTPTLPHTHSPGLKPDVWMLPSTQGGALAGLATGDRGMSRCPMWTCFAGLWLRPPEIALRRPHRVPWRDRRPTHFSGCGGVAAGGDRKAWAPSRPGPQLKGLLWGPARRRASWGRTRGAEPLGSRESEPWRKHLHSAREKGDHLWRAAGIGSCLPQPLGGCGEITSRPRRGIHQPPGPASPCGGEMLPSGLIAPCWIREALWIVQQAYCH